MPDAGGRTLFRRWGDLVVRRPVLFVAAVLAVCAVLGLGALRVRLSVREDAQLPQDHPYVQVYNRLNERFGGGAAVVIGILPRTGDAFTPEVLGKLSRITAAVEAMPELGGGVVWSLASARVKRIGLADGELDVQPFMGAPPRDAAALAKLRADVLADPRLVGTLVAADGRGVAVVADFPTEAQGPALQRRLETIVAAERDEATDIVLAGGPVIVAALD